ncbi:MAG: hypothetical protein Q4G08_04065 [Capnocytophaga sp.]|nr:hypothetical protein [Capnocytophaga sp.]
MKSLSLTNLYEKKFKTFAFEGIWAETFGTPEVGGIWLVYGAEKHGKTWFCLKLAEYLSKFKPTLYVSAEEGTGLTFIEACKRANLDTKNRKLNFLEYTDLNDIRSKISKRRGPKVMVIDNITVYQDELKNGTLRKLTQEFENILFVYIAHEQDNEPYTATAKMAKRLAKIIVRVEGLAARVSGRCPGGVLNIDENKALIYHGTTLNPNP